MKLSNLLKVAMMCACTAAATAYAVDVAATRNGTLPLARPTSIAIVNIQQVFDQLDEKRDSEKVIEQKFATQRTELTARAKDIEALNTKANAMPPGDERSTALSDIQLQAAQLQATQQKYARDMGTMRLDATAKLYQKIAAAAEQLRQRGSFDMVLVTEAMPSPQTLTIDNFASVVAMRKVIAFAPEIDVTKNLLEDLNKGYAAGK